MLQTSICSLPLCIIHCSILSTSTDIYVACKRHSACFAVEIHQVYKTRAQSVGFCQHNKQLIQQNKWIFVKMKHQIVLISSHWWIQSGYISVHWAECHVYKTARIGCTKSVCLWTKFTSTGDYSSIVYN